MARVFSVPREAHPLDAAFGSELRLAGYAFDAARGLTLHWQALAKKHACRTVRFDVQTRGSEVILRPVLIRD